MKDDRNFTLDPRMLRSLKYFECVARRGSVKAAAAEVGVSPSAISHQLHELTAFVGEELFVRSGRGIKLTDDGDRLYRHISSMFSNLSEVLESVIGRKKAYLRLGVCSSFGPYWLAPRLPDFIRGCPGIDLEMHLFAQDPLQTEMVADAVVTADPLRDGFMAVTLFEEQLVAVASPSFGSGMHKMPAQLITTDVWPNDLGQDWQDYSALTGRNFVASSSGAFIPCTHYVLALSMAIAGIGAALVPDFVAAEALAAGDLVTLDRHRLSSNRVYKLCYKASRARDPDLRQVGRWIKSQVNSSAEHLPETAFA